MAKLLSDDRACQSAKTGPNGARMDYGVKGFRGLRLRVSMNGKGHVTRSWSLQYVRRSDSVRRRISLGLLDALPLAEAKEMARIRLGEVAAGGDPASENRVTPAPSEAAAPAITTFQDLATAWLATDPRPKSKGETERVLKRDIYPVLGTRPAKEVTKQDVSACVSAIAKRAPILSNRALSIIHAIYAWGERNRDFEYNPARIDKPAKERQRKRVLSLKEVKIFWLSLDRLNPIFADILKLCLLLGQRVNEIAQAPKAEFDLEAAIWTIPGERTKNGHEHRLPLTAMALEIIQGAVARSPDSAFLFKSPARLADRRLDDKAVTHAWSDMRDTVGLGDVTVHDIRRTCATLAGQNGFDDFQIELVLNHRTGRSKTASIYNRAAYDEPKLEVLQAVQSAVSKAIFSF
jgi:integrase